MLQRATWFRIQPRQKCLIGTIRSVVGTEVKEGFKERGVRSSKGRSVHTFQPTSCEEPARAVPLRRGPQTPFLRIHFKWVLIIILDTDRLFGVLQPIWIWSFIDFFPQSFNFTTAALG